MSLFGCTCKCKCAPAAVLAAVIIGVLSAFLQITGVVVVAPVILWVVLGIAIVYLGILVVAAAVARRTDSCCDCGILGVLLAGILGSVLFSLILLAVGIVATSIVSAVLVGLLLGFFTLIIAGSACYVRCLAGCEV